jgi:ribonuclease PH
MDETMWDGEVGRRADGRGAADLRPVVMTAGIAPAAAGSVLMAMGSTRVICGAGVEESVPPWMRAQGVPGGWVTAEYSMLPYATSPRSRREASAGKVGGRTMEIQRLIGRSLRAIVDLQKLGSRTIWVDCDVLQADGGTRTASVTGAYLALRQAVDGLLRDGRLADDPIRDTVAAVSVGIVGGRVLLDLNYGEDVAAEVDMNVVMTGSGEFVEVQGTAESAPFSRQQLREMEELAAAGIQTLTSLQRQCPGLQPRG